MSDLSHGRTRMPVMVERNFNLRGALKHAIWVESRSKLTSDHTGFKASQHDDGDHILEGQLADPVLISAESTIEVERAHWASQKVFTQARKSEQSILQELFEKAPRPPTVVIWVVDGSYAMTPHMSDILEALENWDWKLPCRSLSHPINPPSSHPITPTRFVHCRRPCLT